MKRYFTATGIFLMVSLFFFSLRAQNNDCYVILEKGTANIGCEKKQDTHLCSLGIRENLPADASLLLAANSLAIVYNNSGFLEVGGKNEEKYAAVLLFSQLSKQPKSNRLTRFCEFLNHTFSEMKKMEKQKGSVVGGARRALFDNDFYYSPDDSTQILSDTVELFWGSVGSFRLLNKLIIVNSGTHDTVYNNKPENPSVVLYNLKEGEYHWTDTVELKNKVFAMNNLFYIPPPSKKKRLHEELSRFNEMISTLSPETRDFLTDEYFSQNRIYVRKK